MIDVKQFSVIGFDLDWTLVKPKTGATFRKTPDDWEFLPLREMIIHGLHLAGKHLFVATNQGGVAFGIFKEDDIRHEIYAVTDILEISFVAICYYHPTAKLIEYREDSSRRKPKPGMLQEAMRWFRVSPEQVLFVGDSEEDKQAAQNAGVTFCDAKDFFIQDFFTNGMIISTPTQQGQEGEAPRDTPG